MIRKTLICIVGALAGASTGAYHDGFFERENVVTNAYNTAYEEVVSRYNEFSSPDGTTDADLVASHLGGKVMEPSTSAVSTSSVDKTTEDLSASENSSATPAHESGMSDAKSKIMRMSKEGPTELADAASDATDEMGSASKQTEEDQASSNDEVASKDSADEMKATEEKSALAAAKEMALLDVRFSKETFESPSGGELKYRKLSPRTAGAGQPLPLIVFLHGAQQRGDDNVSQLQHGLSFIASREGMQQFPATIIAPQCPKQTRWTTTLENRPGKGELDPVPSEVARMTLELIDSMQFTGNIDPDRIYITGLSMGGFGTFDLISRRPSTFAAAVPLCGGGDTSPTVINRIKQTPLWVIHGDEDPVVRVKYSRQMVKALRAADAPVRYSELAGYKHNIWDENLHSLLVGQPLLRRRFKNRFKTNGKY